MLSLLTNLYYSALSLNPKLKKFVSGGFGTIAIFFDDDPDRDRRIKSGILNKAKHFAIYLNPQCTRWTYETAFRQGAIAADSRP